MGAHKELFADRTERPRSEAVKLFAYDADAEELYVTFPEGHTCVYYSLLPREFARFLEAESRGTFVNSVIKRICLCKRVARIPSRLRVHRG